MPYFTWKAAIAVLGIGVALTVSAATPAAAQSSKTAATAATDERTVVIRRDSGRQHVAGKQDRRSGDRIYLHASQPEITVSTKADPSLENRQAPHWQPPPPPPKPWENFHKGHLELRGKK
jgi:hypothetical protein